jgi:micrococcal nuclease
MIPQGKKLIIFALLLILAFAPLPVCSADNVLTISQVLRVIDGDTFEIQGGERVRLLGIDTPENGDLLSDVAASRLRELVKHGPVDLRLCDERDKYGRLLATVSANGSDVNRILLREGLALPMLIPPCGRTVAEGILVAAGKGAMSGKGIYSLDKNKIISHTEACDHVGERAIVRGKILKLHKGRKAWHLNFGQDYRTDFTAVMFRDGQNRFSELGLDPALLVGSEVLVIGKVKRYNGPEIIVHGPDQILPLEGMTIQNSRSKIQKDSGER